MTLTCGCDMPSEIYADWLQDQGWDTDEFRAEEDVVLADAYYDFGSGYYTDNQGQPVEYGSTNAVGSGNWFGYGGGFGMRGDVYGLNTLRGDAQ